MQPERPFDVRRDENEVLWKKIRIFVEQNISAMHTSSSMLELVNHAAQLDSQNFKQFIAKVYQERAKHHTRPLDKAESDLLKKINMGFPSAQWERLDFLDTKLEAGDLSETEHKELIALIDTYERYMLQRVKHLGKLAELRQTTLREVMQQLGITHKQSA